MTYSRRAVAATCGRLLDPDQCELPEVDTYFVKNMQSLASDKKREFRLSQKQAFRLCRLSEIHTGYGIQA